MKVLKNVFLVIGVLVIIAAGVTDGVVSAFHLPVLVRVSRSNNPGQVPLADPTMWIWIAAGAALVGGVLVGLGLGMPKRTAGAVRHDALEELHRVPEPTVEAPVQAPESQV